MVTHLDITASMAATLNIINGNARNRHLNPNLSLATTIPRKCSVSVVIYSVKNSFKEAFHPP